MEIQINKTTEFFQIKTSTLPLPCKLLTLLCISCFPAISVAASSGFETAKTGLFLGNSQFSACDSNLMPLEYFLGIEGLQFTATQQTGTDSFSEHVLPPQLPYDIVTLTSRESGWNQLGYQANLSYAAALHQQIVEQGARTVLWMTYLIGYGPTKDLTYRNTITQYWTQLETDLENIIINGSNHDVLLIPVLELWELGRAEYPINLNAQSCSYRRGFQTDRMHATRFGQYAVGVLAATFLSCKDPRLITDNAPFPESDKQWAKDASWALLNSSYRPDHCLLEQTLDPLLPAESAVDPLLPAESAVDPLLPAESAVDPLLPAGLNLDPLLPAEPTIVPQLPVEPAL
jgi:hypothetical protein